MRESCQEQGKVGCVVVATRSIPNRPAPGCPLCHANGKLVVVAHYPPELQESEASAYLVLAKNSPNGNDYLVVPGNHAGCEQELPDDFTAACKYLSRFIPWMAEATADPASPNVAGYHTGTNWGASAGATIVGHGHQWYSLVPAGYYVPGIATQTQRDVKCQNVTGQSRDTLMEGMLNNTP